MGYLPCTLPPLGPVSGASHNGCSWMSCQPQWVGVQKLSFDLEAKDKTKTKKQEKTPLNTYEQKFVAELLKSKAGHY